MKRVFFVGVVALVSGCVSGPVNVVHKTGSSFAQRQLAADECRIEGLKQVPQSMVTDYNPGYYNPGTIQCNTFGNMTSCNRVGAVNIPASSSTHDVNQSLRDRTVARCLAAKGYDIVQKPICSSSKDADAYRAVRDSQPTADRIACVTNEQL